MAARVTRVDLHKDEVAKILRSAPVREILDGMVSRIATAAGPGHNVRVYQGRDRLRAEVWTGTYAARLSEAENRTLTRAIDAGRF